MAKPKSSPPPVQDSLFPPLTVDDAIREFQLQLQELDLVRAKMSEAYVELKALSGSAFHVQFVDSVTFYKGVLLTLKL